jgi:transcription antitermination factor NusG
MAKPFSARPLILFIPQFEPLYRVDWATLRLNMRRRVSLQVTDQQLGGQVSLPSSNLSSERDRNWYAIFTYPQHEKSVAKQLAMREVESFLPTYETVRVWKNRQRKKIVLPLFPTYLFVRIDFAQRTRVLQSPGVLQIVGNGKESVALPDAEIEFLRSGLCRERIEPYRELVIGTKVRIKSGAMQGVEGTLVRKNENMRFILTLRLINQHAAIQVNAEDLEPALD